MLTTHHLVDHLRSDHPPILGHRGASPSSVLSGTDDSQARDGRPVVHGQPGAPATPLLQTQPLTGAAASLRCLGCSLRDDWAAGAAQRDRDRERSLLLALLHLGALWALAVAQPLFDLIGQNPDFLAARGMRGLEVVRFAVLIALAPPLILVALEAGSGLVVAGLRRWLHSALVAVLFGLIGDPGAQADT